MQTRSRVRDDYRPIGMTKIENTVLVGDKHWNKWNSRTLSVVMQNGTEALEKRMILPYKVKHKLTI